MFVSYLETVIASASLSPCSSFIAAFSAILKNGKKIATETATRINPQINPEIELVAIQK